MIHILKVAGEIALGLFGLGFMVWVSVRSIARSDDPAKLIFKWIFTIPFCIGCLVVAHKLGPFGPFVIVFMAIVLTVLWTPHIGEIIARPLESLYNGGNEPPEPKPAYSIATAQRKRRNLVQAIASVREQLAKFPNDYEGVLLLASIQAEDMSDLASAEISVHHFCDSPDAPPKQIAALLTLLADWQLKIGRDVDSAKAALQGIIDRFPQTELSLQAAQRMARLSGTKKILLATDDRVPMAVPRGVENVGLLESSAHLRPQEEDPGQLATVYVKHLEEHPADAEVREKLAVIYADHFKRLDMATLELMQLVNEPNQPPKRVAHWLNLLADLQVRGGADYETVRKTLEQIVERFEGSHHAEQARSRLSRLKLEVKAKEENRTVKLGVYEQDIGLKGRVPPQ